MQTHNTDEKDPIDIWLDTTPENKLELIEGQLIISTLKGSRRMLWYLLQDYGPDMFLPMAQKELWLNAVIQAFNPSPVPQTYSEWTEWADKTEWNDEPEPAGPYSSAEHRRIHTLLFHALLRFTRMNPQGEMLGRDFVIRLGENGFTPDLIFINRNRMKNLHSYYLDGPPDLAVEITLGESADTDRHLKRRYYEQAGIPEYWLIESDPFHATFLNMGTDGIWHEASPDSRGIYHSPAAEGLALSVPHLRTMSYLDKEEWHLPFLPVDYRSSEPLPKVKDDPDYPGWDSLPFIPRAELQPVPIRFEEYISWCPRAKFEHDGMGTIIDSHEGTRRVSGMLLMTFGITETVRLLHPREWVTFLNKEHYQPIVQKYADDLLKHAKYEKREDYSIGSLPQMPEISAFGKTMKECRQDMAEIVRVRILLKIARREKLPTV